MNSIQRNWENSWLIPATSGVSDEERANIKLEIAREVEWMTRVPDLDAQLAARIDKVDTLLAAHDNDISAFDTFWSYRKSFWQFVLSS